MKFNDNFYNNLSNKFVSKRISPLDLRFFGISSVSIKLKFNSLISEILLSTRFGWFFGFISTILVFFLQKAKLAKAAPCAPIIILALLKRNIWFKNGICPTL